LAASNLRFLVSSLFVHTLQAPSTKDRGDEKRKVEAAKI